MSVRNCVIWDNVTIGDNCTIENALVCENVTIGSGVRIETGTMIDKDVKVFADVVIPENTVVSCLRLENNQYKAVEDSKETKDEMFEEGAIFVGNKDTLLEKC